MFSLLLLSESDFFLSMLQVLKRRYEHSEQQFLPGPELGTPFRNLYTLSGNIKERKNESSFLSLCLYSSPGFSLLSDVSRNEFTLEFSRSLFFFFYSDGHSSRDLESLPVNVRGVRRREKENRAGCLVHSAAATKGNGPKEDNK
jgi:hypothetical protein